METKKVLSALCYFSIFFAGIIFPIVVFFVSKEKEVKSHAKKALFSHLVPLIPVPFLLIAVFMDMAGGNGTVPVLFIAVVVMNILLSLIVVIWNIIKGIKVLSNGSVKG